jgi:hypothetical protein
MSHNEVNAYIPVIRATAELQFSFGSESPSGKSLLIFGSSTVIGH